MIDGLVQLTIDELKMMVNKPVYIVDKVCDGEGWFVTGREFAKRWLTQINIDTYENIWRAYTFPQIRSKNGQG